MTYHHQGSQEAEPLALDQVAQLLQYVLFAPNQQLARNWHILQARQLRGCQTIGLTIWAYRFALQEDNSVAEQERLAWCRDLFILAYRLNDVPAAWNLMQRFYPIVW